MILLFLLQNATPASSPVVTATLERRPALLSLVFLGGISFVVILLLLSLIRSRKRVSALTAVAEEDLPSEVRRKLGATSTNRGLKLLRALFVVLTLGVFCFHFYWARYAEKSNPKFQELAYKDLRNRRLNDGTLRGWIFDRTGKLDDALAFYKKDADGNIIRTYADDFLYSQIFGTDRGSPGLERALFSVRSSVAPESWQVVAGKQEKQVANQDVRLTIDSELQKAAAEQFKGKRGAVVMLNPQTGEILAIYSSPTYSLQAAQNETQWLQLDADKRDNPLVNRALQTYYVPGSTFKTFMLINAFRYGFQDSIFTGSGGGYFAEPGAKPITDDNGSCEVCGQIDIRQSFKISSNQYFAQMAVALGAGRLRETAKLLGMGAYNSPQDGGRASFRPDLFNSNLDTVRGALSPVESWIVTGDKMRRYDLALEGFGQGYAGQQTPMQMALIVSAIANLDGRLMKLKIEYDRKPEMFSQVTTPQNAAAMREIMGLVTQPGGTGARALAPATAAGIISGGKTGTAQKVVPLYDEKTGQPKVVKKYEYDSKGNIIREYEQMVFADEPRIDGWYLSFAPVDKPVIAMAVVVEGPKPGVSNYGGTSAAPIANQLLLKAKQLGYFGGARNEGSNNTANGNNNRRATRRRTR